MQAAREGKRSIELAALPCQNEHAPRPIEWMESEGLKVEHKKWMAKPTGIGSMFAEDDDEYVEDGDYCSRMTKYQIYDASLVRDVKTGL